MTKTMDNNSVYLESIVAECQKCDTTAAFLKEENFKPVIGCDVGVGPLYSCSYCGFEAYHSIVVKLSVLTNLKYLY